MELVLDQEKSLIVKAGGNGVAEVSLLVNLKGMALRMGVESNLWKGELASRFGAEIKLDK